MAKIALLLALVTVASAAAASPKIEARLAATLAFGADATANVLVSFPHSTAGVLAQFTNGQRVFATHGERTTAVAEALRGHADKSQAEARSFLASYPTTVDFEIFWITNQIYIRGADSALVTKLAALPSVSGIAQEFEVSIIPHTIHGPHLPRLGVNAEWGIEHVEAEEAWALPGGNNGTGVVVANIDTGVLATHVDLAPTFRGVRYGWRDVTTLSSATPRDNNGHGTHTMGTIVGQNGIGVAPGAKWIACQALTAQGSGTNAGLISCGQWVACPTLPTGFEPDCTQAPHVVSNSWGGGNANPFYNDVINAWHAANIIPVFAVGNSGPDCSTINSPGDSLAGVFGVGATNINHEVASFSSKGPTVGGRQKPDIAAPGQNVRSAWNTPGTNGYNTISGTSMATPHVAGIIALLKAKNSALTYFHIVPLLEDHAEREKYVSSNYNCGGIDEATWPNMVIGHGIANARKSLAAALLQP